MSDSIDGFSFPCKVRYSLRGMQQLRGSKPNKEGTALSKTKSGAISVQWIGNKYRQYLHPSFIEATSRTSHTTIKTLSDYQLNQLRGYFSKADVLKIGVIVETGDVLIEYSSSNRGLHSNKIPLNKPQ